MLIRDGSTIQSYLKSDSCFHTKLISLFVFSLLTVTVSAQIQVVEKAPDFFLQVLGEQEGVTVSLDGDLPGKEVYIYFYGATCGVCRQSAPVTEREIYQLYKNDTSFVALGMDTWNMSISANYEFKKDTEVSYDLLLNAQNTLLDYYDASGDFNRSVVVGPDGILRYKGSMDADDDYYEVIQVIQTQLTLLGTDNEEDPDLPSKIRLDQNYPNPFNPSTEIHFLISEAAPVSLRI